MIANVRLLSISLFSSSLMKVRFSDLSSFLDSHLLQTSFQRVAPVWNLQSVIALDLVFAQYGVEGRFAGVGYWEVRMAFTFVFFRLCRKSLW